MNRSNHWHDRMQHRDQVAVDAIADWVSPIQWQWFATLTFPWNVRSETADRKFKQFINELERALKTRIGHLIGKEGSSKSGSPVPWHFHCCLTSLKPIPVSLLNESWGRLVGRTNAVTNDSLDVQPYNAGLHGVEYITKMIGTLDAEWDFNWLHLFNPAIEYTAKFDHRSLRGARRWEHQVALRTSRYQTSHLNSLGHLTLIA